MVKFWKIITKKSSILAKISKIIIFCINLKNCQFYSVDLFVCCSVVSNGLVWCGVIQHHNRYSDQGRGALSCDIILVLIFCIPFASAYFNRFILNLLITIWIRGEACKYYKKYFNIVCKSHICEYYMHCKYAGIALWNILNAHSGFYPLQ